MPQNSTVKRLTRGPILWIALFLLLLLVGTQVVTRLGGPDEVSTSEIIATINSGDVSEAVLTDKEQRVEVTLKDESQQYSYYIDGQGLELQQLLQEKVDAGQIPEGYTVDVPQENIWVTLLVSFLPLVIILGLLFFFITQMQGGGRGIMSFSKSKAKVITKDMPQTTFADVAGAEEAVQELEEIKDFLEDPVKFQKVGAKIPRGVLLYGPPGTGKTLLARAVAGEAGVPFFSISGSDFVEMFVGVGASRVRDLFEQAKENAPAIIFVDEIDAVGRHRGAGMGGGHDEREQTLNQLLVEMDGFDNNASVILIAATNRPDILDPALLRPGRFDRQIAADRPDLEGRAKILQVHAKGKPMAPDVDLLAVARRTPGFTGADLANVLNEGALLTARQNQEVIDNKTLDEAIDRVVAGPQRASRVMDEREKLITAYHEGGHALVAAALPGNDPVHKITILPRGRALGYTMVLPESDKHSTTRSDMLNQLAYMLGGRAAEELIFHDPTTGAANDIEKATGVARAMVTQFGMTERLGAIRYGQNNDEPFLGRDMGHMRDYSEQVAAAIDEEVRGMIEAAHQEAFDVLVINRDVLDSLVTELMERETLNKAEVAEIFSELRMRDPRPAWTGSANRQPSELPPVDLAVGAGGTSGSNGSNGSQPSKAGPAEPAAIPANEAVGTGSVDTDTDPSGGAGEQSDGNWPPPEPGNRA